MLLFDCVIKLFFLIFRLFFCSTCFSSGGYWLVNLKTLSVNLILTRFSKQQENWTLISQLRDVGTKVVEENIKKNNNHTFFFKMIGQICKNLNSLTPKLRFFFLEFCFYTRLCSVKYFPSFCITIFINEWMSIYQEKNKNFKIKILKNH